MGSRDPNDPIKTILPRVKEAMKVTLLNCIISGCKTPESEVQNYDPEKVIQRFQNLMNRLPVSLALFSPTIGGVACYGVLKKSDNTFETIKAHENPEYQQYIGSFKKPGIGMFIVARHIIEKEFGLLVNNKTTIMIGDTWHDEAAAEQFGIPFIDASIIHSL